jgi:hypothetical protein
MIELRRACVFCGSREGARPTYTAAAAALAKVRACSAGCLCRRPARQPGTAAPPRCSAPWHLPPLAAGPAAPPRREWSDRWRPRPRDILRHPRPGHRPAPLPQAPPQPPPLATPLPPPNDNARISQEMVRRDIGLVYGGGTVGLMGVIATGVASGLGPQRVFGVIPRALTPREISNEMIGDTKVVDDMHERKVERGGGGWVEGAPAGVGEG